MWTSVEVLLCCALRQIVLYDYFLDVDYIDYVRFRQVFRCAARREGIIYDHLQGSDPVFTRHLFCASE